jgi:hypothetical protein
LGVCFLILFPSGAVTMRFLRRYFRYSATFHMTIQLISLALTLIGTGLGVWLTPNGGRSTQTRTSTFIRQLMLDDILGLFLASFLVCQALLGYYHHYRFVNDRPSDRRWFTYLHIVGGIILIIMGIYNGPSGLTLARVPTKYVSLWWAFGTILPLFYFIAWIVKCCMANSRTRNSISGDVAIADSRPCDPQELRPVEK